MGPQAIKLDAIITVMKLMQIIIVIFLFPEALDEFVHLKLSIADWNAR